MGVKIKVTEGGMQKQHSKPATNKATWGFTGLESLDFSEFSQLIAIFF